MSDRFSNVSRVSRVGMVNRVRVRVGATMLNDCWVF